MAERYHRTVYCSEERRAGPRLKVYVPHGWTVDDALWRLWMGQVDRPNLAAQVREFVVNVGTREFAPRSVALRVLQAIEVVDNVHKDAPDDCTSVLAALILRQGLMRRALLYYDCCAVLGYDPAEESAPVK